MPMVEKLAQDAAPLGERLLLAAVGPVVGGVVGTGLITLLVWLVQRRLAERDKAKERESEAAEKRLARQRADDEIRHDLITEMTSVAVALYLATQRFWRESRHARGGANVDRSAARNAMDKQYIESRTRGEIVDVRVRALFVHERPAVKWHEVMDLLTVRYFQLTGEDSISLYRENEKGFQGQVHSGLTAAELRNSKLLLDSYRAALAEVIELLFAVALKDRAVVAPVGAEMTS